MDVTLKILTHTIFDTILLPLTIVSAMYGINGIALMRIIGLAEWFAIVAMTMLVTIAVTLLFFKKKRWIFDSDDDFNSVLKRRDILIVFYDVIYFCRIYLLMAKNKALISFWPNCMCFFLIKT